MASTPDSSVHQRFSSRAGLLLSTLGVAVGTGNIWRFPRIAAVNGSDDGAGAFLFTWFVFLFAWSIPLIVAEYALGRRTRQAPVGVFVRSAGPRFAWMGGFLAGTASAIAFYYSVICGWCLYYLLWVVRSPLPTSTAAAVAVWDDFQSGMWPVVFHAAALVLVALCVWKGVESIEKVNKVFMPALLAIVLASAIRAVTLPGAWEGVAYLFTPDWTQLTDPRVWLEALTQNAWDTGAGWGMFLVYAAYMRKEELIVKNAALTAGGNNLVSLVAGIMIFGAAFAILNQEMSLSRSEVLAVLRDSGPASTGLTLIWMPQLFARMFGGEIVAVLFFLGLTLAGFTSLISMVELETRTLVDLGVRRTRAVAIAVGINYLVGLPSALSVVFLSNQDFVWGLALMLCGAFVALGVTIYGAKRLRTEEILPHPGDYPLGRFWDYWLKYAIPALSAILLAWWLFLSATVYSPGRWLDPTDPYSVATCVVQWAVLLALVLGANRFLAARTRAE